MLLFVFVCIIALVFFNFVLFCIIVSLRYLGLLYFHRKHLGLLYIKHYSLLQILVTHRMSWKRTSHNFCNSKEDDIDNRRLVRGVGALNIMTPSRFLYNVASARFVCTDFSISEDWVMGEFTDFKMNYTAFVSLSYFYIG